MYDSKFGNVAMLMCNIINPNGKNTNGCCRSILKRELVKMKKLGYAAMNIGFELEFFLLSDRPTDQNKDKVCLDHGDYGDMEGEKDATASVRREIMFELERIGITPLVSHHERAVSAYEISYKYSDAMRACDNLLLAKHIISEVACRHNLYADFQPKPFKDENGNGLHTNISLTTLSGKNAFEENNKLSPIAKHFMAGILSHAKELCALTNPTQNSYKRLVRGYEAPTKICCGKYNREAMIRIPKASGESTRIEMRNPDACINPYLALTAILRAGLIGIKNKAALLRRFTDFSLADDLPESLDEAYQLFEKSTIFSDLVTLKLK